MIRWLLALDPGRQGFGWALFKDGVLYHCGVVRQPEAEREHEQPALYAVAANAAREIAVPLYDMVKNQVGTVEIVIERMRFYPKKRASRGHRHETEQARTAKANDLLDLQAIGGVVVGAISAMLHVGAVHYVYPSEWKGSTDTTAIQKRLWTVGENANPLTNAEAELLWQVRPRGLVHNAVDASAMGLVHEGRLRLV